MWRHRLSLVSGCAVVLGTTWQLLAPVQPKLLYNPTASAPVGFYRLRQSNAFKLGDRVAAHAPEWATLFADQRDYVPSNVPLIKSIWAIPGDVVCRSRGTVMSSDRAPLMVQEADSKGRPMPVWSGCMTLEEGQYFLVSTDTQTSWDSRYFGPIERSAIVGKVVFLGQQSGAQGGARGPSEAAGLYGKIKGGRAPEGLSPCLHISFRGVPFESGVTPKVPETVEKAGEKGSAPCSEDPARSRKPE